MIKKYLCAFLMFFISVLLSSQELILKVKNPPTIAGWVYQKGALENSYCLYDNNYLIFASSTNQQKPIIHIYKEHYPSIISTSFHISNSQFVALDNENTVLEAKFDDLENTVTRKVHETLVAKSISLSPNGDMEVLGLENGFVQTHYLLKRSKKNFDVHFKGHDDVIYSVSFNSLGEYFITSGKDEKLKIWDAKTLSLIKELPLYSQNLCPAIFSALNDSFIYSTSSKTLCVSDVEGKFQKEIAIIDGIKLAKFTEKKDRIAVLTDNKKLEFYNITTGEYEGAINSLEDVCSFDINIVTGAILVGTEEGEVYLASNKDIKIIKEKQTKKDKVNNTKVSKETKTPVLSTHMIKYLALEEDEDIQEPQSNNSYLSIKDETPLEDPFIFNVKKEASKKTPTKIVRQALNEAALDEEEAQNDNTEPIASEEAIETTEEDIQKDSEPENETQENEANQNDEDI